MTALLKWMGVLLCAIGLVAAGAGAAPAAAPPAVVIAIGAMAFSTPKATIKIGDTVEWVNNDIVDHTATEKSKLWDVSMAPGQRARVVMKKAGTFDYFCRYHPNMIARLLVAAPAKK